MARSSLARSFRYIARRALLPALAMLVGCPVALNARLAAADPVVSITAAPDCNPCTEGAAGTTKVARAKLRLSAPVTQDVHVNVATEPSDPATGRAGIDFSSVQRSVRIPAGSLEVPVDVAILGDAIWEFDESFLLSIGSASGATVSESEKICTIQIKDDDGRPTILVDPPSCRPCLEGVGMAYLNLRLSAVAERPVCASISRAGDSSASGEDYEFLPRQFSFQAGQTTYQLGVRIVDDTEVEPEEKIGFSITSGSAPITCAFGGAVYAAIRIKDDDSYPVVTTANEAIAEGNTGTTNLTVRVRLSKPVAYECSVQYQLVGESATAGLTCGSGADFVSSSGTLRFEPNETERALTVPVCGEAVLEGNETFRLALTTPTKATIASPASATCTILNDEAPWVSIAGLSLAEGTGTGLSSGGDTRGGSASPTVTLSHPTTSDVTVTYATAPALDVGTTSRAIEGTACGATGPSAPDYVRTTTTLTIRSGATTGRAAVEVCPDALREPNEVFNATLVSAANAKIDRAKAVAKVVIQNDD